MALEAGAGFGGGLATAWPSYIKPISPKSLWPEYYGSAPNWQSLSQVPPKAPPSPWAGLPGRMLTLEEEREYIPPLNPWQQYGQLADIWRASGGDGGAEIFPRSQTAALREKAFAEMGLGTTAQHSLRRVPLVAGPGEAWQGGMLGPDTGWPEGAIAMIGESPRVLAHEYAHAWFKRMPEAKQQEFIEMIDEYAAATKWSLAERAKKAGNGEAHWLLPSIKYAHFGRLARELAEGAPKGIEEGYPWAQEYFPRITEFVMTQPEHQIPPEVAAYYRGFFERWPQLPTIWKR